MRSGIRSTVPYRLKGNLQGSDNDNINASSDGRGDRDRGDRREGRERGRRSDKNFTRFFINLGEKHRVKAPNLIGMINEFTRNRNIEIGKIEVNENRGGGGLFGFGRR